MRLTGLLEPGDVLLLISPTSDAGVPSPGLHLLQAVCAEKNIAARLLYSNFFYLGLVGARFHRTIASDNHLLPRERLFARAAFGVDSVSLSRSMHKFSDPGWAPDHIWKPIASDENLHIPQPAVTYRQWLENMDLERLERQTTDWVRSLAREIAALDFAVVGCSTTYGGLLPAVALLDHVKKANPRIITIIGGALCDPDAAEGILALGTGIDYVFSGEGEITFPPTVQQILDGRLPGEKIIQGLPPTDLDKLPAIDYHDYLEQGRRLHPDWPKVRKILKLSFETSRGCSHGKCTFCGLNGKKKLFRRKSPGIIIGQLKKLQEQHGINIIEMTDTMMPPRYFDTLVPRLSQELPSVRVIYETRPGLTLDQVIALKKTCTGLKTGIETLSASMLGRMNKPATIRENIDLMRYSRSVGINLVWALLVGLPGDRAEEYEDMLRLLPLFRHLQPPTAFFPLILWRDSRYQRTPGAFGITGLRPAEVFGDILPANAHLEKIAYYFSGDYPSQLRENPSLLDALWTEYRAWRKAWALYNIMPMELALPRLHISRESADHYILEDTRELPGLPQKRKLNREQAAFLLASRPLDQLPGADVKQAETDGLGIISTPWFIPLAAADPSLLREFEPVHMND
jgi:magnesium-protoporphyrin IX monomethyl ester (oxidative) cyclase